MLSVQKIISRLVLFLAAVVSLSACGGMFFYPSQKLLLDPSEILLDYEDVYFDAEDGVHLHGWFLPATNEPLGTVIFLHGNAENISNHLANVYWLPKEGFNVFLFDYRGFGLSEGTPDIAGSIKDAEAALEAVLERDDVDEDKIALLGQSLGGALAIYVAAHSEYRQHLKAVIIESAFASYREIAREKIAYFWLTAPFKWPLSFLITPSFDPIDAIAAISPIPLLLIHGERDEVVPVHHVHELFDKALEPKRLWLIPDGDHQGAFRSALYRHRFADYLRAQFSTLLAAK